MNERSVNANQGHPMHCPEAPAANESYVVEHRLQHRVRIRFRQPLCSHRMRSLLWLMEQQQAGFALRPASSGRGLVLWSLNPEQSIHQGLQLLEQTIQLPPAHLAAPPERGLPGVLQRSRLGSIKMLMALAVAGWALPVLPGTPFFLMAWWLGWRPPQPSQRNTTSTKGAQTLAEAGSR
jgi:hypothetical protein